MMDQTKTNSLKNEIQKFIVKWNNNFPIDRWWREKHSIPFGSKAHKEANFIQMLLEYEEDKMLQIVTHKSNTEESSGFFLEGEQPMTKEEIDKEFDDLDLDNLNIK